LPKDEKTSKHGGGGRYNAISGQWEQIKKEEKERNKERKKERRRRRRRK
jgi:hypothetical protein